MVQFDCSPTNSIWGLTGTATEHQFGIIEQRGNTANDISAWNTSAATMQYTTMPQGEVASNRVIADVVEICYVIIEKAKSKVNSL